MSTSDVNQSASQLSVGGDPIGGLKLVLAGHFTEVGLRPTALDARQLNDIYVTNGAEDIKRLLAEGNPDVHEIKVPLNPEAQRKFLAAWIAKNTPLKKAKYSLLLLPLAACGGSDEPMTKLKIIDGYISGATVFRDLPDSNGLFNGIWDPGEAKSTSNQSGSAVLATSNDGIFIAFGGENINSLPGTEFTLIMKAPAGATSVTPLTTLVVELMEVDTSLTLSEAVAKVQTALGLSAVDLEMSSSPDILTLDPYDVDAVILDPYDAGVAGNVAVAKAGIKVAALLEAVSGGEAGEAVAKVLASKIALSSGAVNLSDANVLQTIIEEAQTANPSLADLVAIDAGSIGLATAYKNDVITASESLSNLSAHEGATFSVSETDGLISYAGTASGGIVVNIDSAGVASFVRSGVQAVETVNAALTKQFSGENLTFNVTNVPTSGDNEIIVNVPDVSSLKFYGAGGTTGVDRYVIKINDPDTDASNVDVRRLTLDTSFLTLDSDDLIVFDFIGQEDSVVLNEDSNISNVPQIEIIKGSVDFARVTQFTGSLKATQIAPGNESNALTAYITALPNATSVTLSPADGAWSIAASTLTTALSAGVRITDFLTVKGIASNNEATASTTFSTSNTGATSITLASADGTWSVATATLDTDIGNSIKYAGALTVTGIASGGEAAALMAYTTAMTGARTNTLTADDATWSVTVGTLDTALAAGVRLAGTLTVTDISDEAAALTAYTTANTGAITNILTADGAWSVAGSTLKTALDGGVRLVGTLAVTDIAADDEANASATFSKANTGAMSITLAAADGAWSVKAVALNADLSNDIKYLGALTVTDIAAESEATALTTYSTSETGTSSVILSAADGTWSVQTGALDTNIGNSIKYAGALTVTGIAVGNKTAALTDYTTVKTGATTNTLTADGTWSLAAAPLKTALDDGVRLAGTLTVTGITNETVALTDYTATTTGATSVTLIADGAWSVTAADLTAALDDGVLLDGTLAVASIASDIETTALTAFTDVLTGATSVTLSASDTNWSVAAATLDTALDANMQLTGNLTVTDISTETNASTTYSKTATGASNVTLTASDGTWSVETGALDTDLNNDIKYASALTVTGIATDNKATALTTYTTAKTGATTNTLTADSNWSLAFATLDTALDAGVRLADALTVTGITSGSETAAITAYTTIKTGATTNTLTAVDDGAWSIAASDLTTALGAGVRLAGTLTVTSIASGNETAALTAYTESKTSATMNTLTASDMTWSVTATDLDAALTAKVRLAGDLTVTGISTETNASTTYSKNNTGAESVTLRASDGTWSIATGALDTDLNVNNSIKYAGDLTVTGIASAYEDAALTKYTTALTGADTNRLTATDGVWSAGAAELTTAINSGVRFVGAVEVTTQPTLAQLVIINNATDGSVTLNVTAQPLSGSASDMSAAFNGITASGYQGNLTITEAVSSSSGVTAINLMTGATSGLASANITASSAELASLNSSASDAITITISDAVNTSVSALTLSTIGGKTASTVTVSNAVVISGTVAQNTAALVTANTKVTAASADVILSDAKDTQIAAHDIVNISEATSGTVRVSNGITLIGSGTEVKQAITLTNLTLPSDFDISVTGALTIESDTMIVFNGVAGSTSGDLAVIGTNFKDTLDASSFTGDGSMGLTINGGNKSDTITGTDFGDIIVGGTGSDNLTGGTGADIFVFNANGNGNDTITDFAAAQNDILDLDAIISGGIYNSGTPVVDTTGDAIALADVDNQFVYYSVADISTAIIDEASLFGDNKEFAAEGSADIQFVLAIGETAGTDGVQFYQVTDSASGNDMYIMPILTLDNTSLADILAANLDVI